MHKSGACCMYSLRTSHIGKGQRAHVSTESLLDMSSIDAAVTPPPQQ